MAPKAAPSPTPTRVPLPHFIEDCPQWAIPNAPGWMLQGHSVAGERTGFAIPSLRLFFDAGVNTYYTASAILLTHSHSDHSHNVPCIAMGQNGVLDARPLILCPGEMAEPLQLLARASQALNDCRPLGAADEVRCRGVAPGDRVPLPLTKAAVEAEVVRCCHTVPTVGFILSETVQQLRPEYRALAAAGDGKALAALRKAGTELNEKVGRPRLAFLGDTTIDVFVVSPQVLAAPVVIVECTFFGDEVTPAQARERGHIHWDDLGPVVAAHPQTTFVLIHFSRRFADADIAAYFAAAAAPPNVVLWLSSGVVALADRQPPDPPPAAAPPPPTLPPEAHPPPAAADTPNSGPSSSVRTGAVPVFILAGQSNMVGRATLPLPEAVAALEGRAFITWCNNLNFPEPGQSDGWQPLQAQWAPSRRTFNYGPEMTLAAGLASRYAGRPLYFIKFALGSTQLDPHWHPQASRRTAYFARFVEFVDRSLAALRERGLAPAPQAVFWLQGEGDTSRARDAEAYPANLTALITALRGHLKIPDLPFIASEIRWHGKKTAEVNAALHHVAATVPKVRCCPASTAPLMKDGHLGTEAVREAGAQLAAAFLPLVSP